MTATPRPQPPFTERTTTANWPLRRAVGNALGYEPSPHYDWAYLDGDKWREYPAWDVDLNVAMTLVGHDFSVTIVPQGKGIYGVYLEHLRTETTHYETNTNIAEAICWAFLAYAARPPQADSRGDRQ